jgi:DNA-binding transcriptional MerR regulator
MLEFTHDENNGFLTATQLSKISGESYRTIDFYSNQGLLRVTGRRGRMRLYEEKETLNRIKKIRKLQNSGYPLILIRENLDKSSS